MHIFGRRAWINFSSLLGLEWETFAWEAKQWMEKSGQFRGSTYTGSKSKFKHLCERPDNIQTSWFRWWFASWWFIRVRGIFKFFLFSILYMLILLFFKRQQDLISLFIRGTDWMEVHSGLIVDRLGSMDYFISLIYAFLAAAVIVSWCIVHSSFFFASFIF